MKFLIRAQTALNAGALSALVVLLLWSFGSRADGPATTAEVDAKAGLSVSPVGTLPEILVQGSQILNIDLKRSQDDEQPYYIFDAETLQSSGAVNVEEFLKTRLTMNAQVADNTQQLALNGNNSIGAVPANSAINLRGLGTNETLILVDGRRLPALVAASFGNSGQPDINGIPISAVERIEVLPSSASAIYGGSAMGGVINIILRKNFTGAELSYNFDNTFSGDAQRRTVSGSFGDTLFGGKTRFMISGHYSDGNPLLAEDRLGILQGSIALINQRAPGYLVGLMSPFQGATPNITSADGSNLVLLSGTSLNSPYTTIPAGFTSGSNLAAALLANAGRQNLNLPNTNGADGLKYQLNGVPVSKSITADLRQVLTDRLEVFADLSLTGNAFGSVFNPLSAMPVYQYYETLPSIPAGSPGNPFQNDINVTLPSNASGPSTSNSVNRSATVGLIARLGGEWSGELDWTWAENSHYWQAFYLDIAQIQAAIAGGTLNPFVDTLAHPLNLQQYNGSQGESGGGTVNHLLFRVSGPVGSLPGGRPTLTIGGEHRKEGTTTEFANDGLFPNFPQDNEYALFYGQSQSIVDGYVEGKVPLVGENNRHPGIEALSVQVAVRYERYSTYIHQGYDYFGGGSDGTFTFTSPPLFQETDYHSFNKTFAVEYSPLTSLTFRASYATAFLPPQAGDLTYAPDGPYTTTITDPKNGQTYPVSYYRGGGPWIQPQTARTIDFGLIWRPHVRYLDGLRVNVERYDIKQPNQIFQYPSPQLIVDTPSLSDWVIRDPTTGQITRVNAYEFNATEFKTSGWDLSIDYPWETRAGQFALTMQGTYVDHDQRQLTPGTPFLEFAGHPNDAGFGTNPGPVKVKANASLHWSRGLWSAGWTTTYLGHYWQVGAPNSPLAQGCSSCGGNGVYGVTFAQLVAAQGGPEVASQTYHQIFGAYSFGEKNEGRRNVLSGMRLTWAIHNLFNKSPPLDAFYYPFFTSPYGSLRLRTYELGFRKSF